MKKRQFQLKEVLREAMENKLKDVVASKIAVIEGTLNGIDYYLFVIKDKDYIAKLMETYRLLSAQNRTK